VRPGARIALRLAAALVLLVLAVRLVGARRLAEQLQQVDRGWLAAAVAAAGLAQVVSVLRWEQIARIFGLRVQRRALAVAYAQGMTLNILLPGATLGGDALRSLRLQALGNPLGESALTVLLDRLSGLWTLCALSLLCALALAPSLGGARGDAGAAALSGALPGLVALLGTGGVLALYVAGLLLACALPWLPLHPPALPAGGGAEGLGRRLWRRLGELHELALAQRRALWRSLWSSLLVQMLSAATLWLCLLAAGGRAPFWQVQAVAAPVFVAGALPLSYGGFGARELMALAAFPLAGVSTELGLAASVLYGVVAIILGLLVAPSFALQGRAAAKEA
jgi:uncharacterized membrane protein YbhN (UPF0104 family)